MKRLLSYLIIAIFSSAILTGAGFTLKVVSEKETNITYLATAIEQRQRVLGLNTRRPENQTIVDAMEKKCAKGADEENSIVDYLYTKGEDYSYGHRAELANRHGISNYVGSKDQNLLLVKKLREQVIACK